MIVDPYVAELRKHRQAHAAAYDNDLERIFEAYKELERKSGRTYVNFEPRRIPARAVSEEAPPYES